MIAHLGIALVIQLLVVVLLRKWWAGAAAAAAWALSREITQAEYRWIEEFGSGLRANLPWWGGLSPDAWHVDAMLDWVIPTLAVMGISILMELRSRKSG